MVFRLALAVILCSFFCNGQNKYFIELSVDKTFAAKKPKLTYNLSGTWKHSFENDNWSRTNVYGVATYNLNPWIFYGGLNTQYTFDHKIKNYFEIRPVLGIKLNTKITDKMKFVQRFQSEGRFFITQNDEINKASLRLRYLISLVVDLSPPENEKGWRFQTDMEWYIVKNEEINERFINSRDLTIWLIKKIPKNKQIAIGILTEKYSKVFDPTATGNGGSLLLQYSF